MNKKLNATIKIVVVIFLLFVIGGISYLIYHLLFYPKVPSRMNDFSLCIKEYTQVAEFYYKDFEKYDTNILIYSVPYDDNDKEIVCFTEGYRHEIMIGENEHQNFLKICDSYRLDKQSLSYICVYDGFVSFCNDNGRSSYVYSIYDKKPLYIKHLNESKEDLHIRKMFDNWYFVCEFR